MSKVYNSQKYAFCVPTSNADSTKDLQRAVCLTDKANANLMAAQKELLRLHYHLGHIGMRHLQWLVRQGKVKVKHKPTPVANCELPKCASCMFGKAQRCPSKAKMASLNKEKEGAIKKQHLLPGQKISADQYVSAVPGRLYTTRGSVACNVKYVHRTN